MRTTLSVDDDLLQRGKEIALAMGVSVSEVMNRAIRRGLDAGAALPPTTATLVFGDPADRIDVDLTAFAEALDEEFLLGKVRGR